MPQWAPDPLRRIRIASPCTADWNEMYGDERVRFCSKCELNVYNLSAMARADAERLLVDREGHLCVRFFRRSDGTILTKDCPIGLRALKQKIGRIAVACISFVFGAGVGQVAQTLASRGAQGYVASEPEPWRLLKESPPPVTVVGGVAPVTRTMGRPVNIKQYTKAKTPRPVVRQMHGWPSQYARPTSGCTGRGATQAHWSSSAAAPRR
jgi:hypothetical protein